MPKQDNDDITPHIEKVPGLAATLRLPADTYFQSNLDEQGNILYWPASEGTTIGFPDGSVYLERNGDPVLLFDPEESHKIPADTVFPNMDPASKETSIFVLMKNEKDPKQNKVTVHERDAGFDPKAKGNATAELHLNSNDVSYYDEMEEIGGTLADGGKALWHFLTSPRVQGGINAAAGTLETVAGLAAMGLGAPTAGVGVGVGAMALGAVVAANGFDTASAGFRQLFSGKEEETGAQQIARDATAIAGGSKETQDKAAAMMGLAQIAPSMAAGNIPGAVSRSARAAEGFEHSKEVLAGGAKAFTIGADALGQLKKLGLTDEEFKILTKNLDEDGLTGILNELKHDPDVARIEARSFVMKEKGAGESVIGKGVKAVKKISKRLLYLGKTPGKYSRTGREVREQMRRAGTLKKNEKGLDIFTNDNWETWHYVDSPDTHMGHFPMAAVTYWNKFGRTLGPKSPGVRQWMLDPKNYRFEYGPENMSAGGKMTERYEDPL